MSLTGQQMAERRWGPPGALPRTIPRNPTGYERTAQGAAPLTREEWSILWTWQAKARRRWTQSPDALTKHKALLAGSWPPAGQLPAEDIPLLCPEPTVFTSDLEQPQPLPAAA